MLHNFIRTEMDFDNMELEINYESTPNINIYAVVINTIEPSNKYIIQRQNLAKDILNTWQASKNL